MDIFLGIIIPFIGTTLGAACVFFLKDRLHPAIQKILLGFASGVMVAASVWSLIIPAIDLSEGMGKLSFLPAAVGILLGMGFLLFLESNVPHQHLDSEEAEGPESHWRKSTMMVLAVTLHNLPEGMAVGVVLAGLLSGESGITTASAITLALGIAIQNFPEGAIISMPLKSEGGVSRKKAFLMGTLSGAVEPVGAALTIFLAGVFLPILPYLLAFAAGAMLYVVVEELIPEASEGAHSNLATTGFAAGFILMMILDVALG